MKPLPKVIGVLSTLTTYLALLNASEVRGALTDLCGPRIGTAFYLAVLILPPAVSLLSHSLTGTGGKPPKGDG